MALIEGIGDDVMTLLFVTFIVLIVIMSWLSTNVRDITVPANLLVIERRSRRLYATSIGGNLTRINTASRLSPSLTTTTSTNHADSMAATASNSRDAASQSQIAAAVLQQEAAGVASSAFEAPNMRQRQPNELELVNEIVEQALVDNLFDGGFYSAEEMADLMPATTTTTVTTNTDASPIASGSGEVVSSLSGATFESAATVDEASSPSAQVAAASSTSIAQSPETSEEVASLVEDQQQPLGDPINILIKFVNEREMRIQARPSDTIQLIKKTHFSQEISNNQIVRFIYQGQFLNDKSTIKSYNIKDQTTIHCHIIATKPAVGAHSNQQQQPSALRPGPDVVLSSSASSALRQRIPVTTTSSVRVPPPPPAPVIEQYSAGQDQARTVSAGQVLTTPVPAPATTTTAGSMDVNKYLLPLVAVVLAACWYFRINFKHFFSPLSTLVLIVLTFVFALFLFNNLLSSSSSLIANNFIVTSRILHSRRGRQQQQQPTTTQPPPVTTAPVAQEQ